MCIGNRTKKNGIHEQGGGEIEKVSTSDKNQRQKVQREKENVLPILYTFAT